MMNDATATVIRTLREKQNLTQRELAERLQVSDKTISKWETGRGLPDLALLEPLAQSLRTSVTELLSGNCVHNQNGAANLLRGKFYVCQAWGNVIYATGEGVFHCCGIPLHPQAAKPENDAHTLHVERVETEFYVAAKHPMEKTHFLSFFAVVTTEQVQLLKLYPEQPPEGRLQLCGHGILYAYCNRHDLFYRKI